MNAGEQFFRLTLCVQEHGGHLRLSETICTGYFTDSSEQRLISCIGRSYPLRSTKQNITTADQAA